MTVTLVEDKDAIKERHLKHIAEISKDLAPLRFAKLTQDQQDFLDRTGPYAPYYRAGKAIDPEAEEEEEDQW